jgi:hypothetical protein
LHLHEYVQELLKCFKGKSDKKKEMRNFYFLCDSTGRIWSCTEANSRIRMTDSDCKFATMMRIRNTRLFLFIYKEKFNWKALADRKVPFFIEVLGQYAHTSQVAGGAGVRFPDTHRHGS